MNKQQVTRCSWTFWLLIAPRKITVDDPHALLMMKYRAGDESALSELFEQYRSPLCSFFRNRLPDQQQAEDAVQDVFVRIIRYSNHYQPTAKFSTWLFTIASNLARDRLRSSRRKRSKLIDKATEFDLAFHSTSEHEQRVEVCEECDLLRDRINALPKRQQQAFQLYYVEEKPYCEIAETLDSSTMAVKGLLARGRRTLRDQFAS